MIPPTQGLVLDRGRALFANCFDDERLLRLVEICHPTRPARTPLYFRLHPTLIVVRPEGLIAYSTMSLTPSLLLLHDTGVHPEARRQGWAAALLAERIRLGLLNGCQLAAGGVEEDNMPMVRLLVAAGFTIQNEPKAPGIIPCTALLLTDPVREWMEHQYDHNPWLRAGD